MTITVKGENFQAHKAVLGARSAVFAAMFEHDIAEKNTNSVSITDCNPDSFQEFLLFLYTGQLEDVTSSKVFSLYETADKYDVKELKEECLQLMKCNLTIHSVCEAVILATNYKETKLLEQTVEFFTQNAADIVESVAWESFIVKYPTIGNALFIKYLRKEKK